MKNESSNYGCANYCERQVESLLRTTPGCPNLNWEEGNVSGWTANFIQLSVHTQFYPLYIYLFIYLIFTGCPFFVVLKFRLCSLSLQLYFTIKSLIPSLSYNKVNKGISCQI